MENSESHIIKWKSKIQNHICVCGHIYCVCICIHIHIYLCIVIKISFGYKFDGRIPSLNTGNLLKWAGSRVNGVCSGVQAAFPWVSTKHKVIFSAQNSRRSLAEKGSCWAVRVPLFQVMGIWSTHCITYKGRPLIRHQFKGFTLT